MAQKTAVLKRTTQVQNAPDRVVFRRLDEEITLEGAGASLYGKIAKHLDGKTPVEEIAAHAGEKPERVKALLDRLAKAGIVAVLDGGARSMTGLEFYDLHRKYAAHWLQPVYDHPLWERMTSGQASRAQVIGFAFEKYHYIEGAHEHMGFAAANATPEMMPHLARHFIEEYTHGDIYRKGLCSLFPDELVLHSQPLPSTRALVNFLSETAQRSSFAYYAGNEVLQMTENTGDTEAAKSIDDFYSAMKQHYPYTVRLIDSFILHTKADQKLGHSDVFKEMCESIPPLSQREVVDAINVAKSMCEHLLLFMHGIDRGYSHWSSVPRVPCNLLSE